MTGLAPADVAVVLRSIARRVREAETAVAEAEESEALPPEVLADLDATVREVAEQAGTATSGERDTLAAAAADRIAHVPADQWTDESLARLRAAAATIGADLRRLEAVAAAARGR